MLGYGPSLKAAARCDAPKCATCELSKAKKRPVGPKTPTPNVEPQSDRPHAGIKAADLQPGQRVSMDHYICTTKGRLYTSRGKSAPDTMYVGGVIFVDHGSGHSHVEHVVNFGASEAIRAKDEYERKMSHMGVIVQNYRTDNGVFAAKDYREQL